MVHRHAPTQQRAGFTLVEILIVVVILGILAAIVIPQFTKASEDARASSLVTQLQTIRSQVELYKVQHNDDWPTTDGKASPKKWDWTLMTNSTDETGDKTKDEFGPYMQSAPKNPFTNADAVEGSASKSAGWVLTGDKIFACMSKAKYDKLFDTDGDGKGDNEDIKTY